MKDNYCNLKKLRRAGSNVAPKMEVIISNLTSSSNVITTTQFATMNQIYSLSSKGSIVKDFLIFGSIAVISALIMVISIIFFAVVKFK